MPTGQTRTGRSTSGGDIFLARRSCPTDSGGDRGDSTEETNALMREYFVQMAEERRERVKREREEERRRVEDEARRAKETRRALREEQMLRYEEERDIRFMRILRSEFKKDGAGSTDREIYKAKKLARTFGRTDALIEEKECLRISIAHRTFGMKEAEDEELLAFRKHAAKLDLLEKRKRGPDLPVGNSPPIVTPEKKFNTRLSKEAKARIDALNSDPLKEGGMSSTPTKIDLSLKHIMASWELGSKERFEQDCHDFYDALTIDELKEACRREKVAYGNGDKAIKRLITRRFVVAYDPSSHYHLHRASLPGRVKEWLSRKRRILQFRNRRNQFLKTILSEVFVVATNSKLGLNY
ncbi:hypothetical protein CBR_g45646 [Chara braunii]|uniref:Uncharacterized protein n=1 Tax=Chara braunii TaxID=69332 RepID=A0A388K3K9_CHABU|nr:hypothetical protein CBR_g45646 [Chara braunii]|eukprot:GBG64589.1 hypothetical protein CBR_g45646 [Chara braunii]